MTLPAVRLPLHKKCPESVGAELETMITSSVSTQLNSTTHELKTRSAYSTAGSWYLVVGQIGFNFWLTAYSWHRGVAAGSQVFPSGVT